MGYYVEANHSCGSGGRWIFESVKDITRTKVYKILVANKIPFTLYKFTGFYDEHQKIKEFFGGSRFLNFDEDIKIHNLMHKQWNVR